MYLTTIEKVRFISKCDSIMQHCEDMILKHQWEDLISTAYNQPECDGWGDIAEKKPDIIEKLYAEVTGFISKNNLVMEV